MTKCVEDLDVLFEEAWDRIPYCYVEQCSYDFPSSWCNDQRTLCAKDANKELTEQIVRAEDKALSRGEVAMEADSGYHSHRTRQGSSDTTISSSPHGTGNRAFPDSRTAETGVKDLCADVQDICSEIKEEFDVFEVKYESEDDLNDFCAEQHHVLDATVNMSKSDGQHQTTDNDVGTTSRAHSVRANENPDVNGGESRTPTEVRGETESAVQGKGDIDSIVTAPSHLNDDHGSIHFYRGLKKYHLRGLYTDVCIDEVRDKVERVIIDRCPYYRCKLCFKTMSDLITTIQHARAHVRGIYFFCGQCGRKFRCKFTYDIHLELHEQGQWREITRPGSHQYACVMCHKFFSTRALLTVHRMTHTEKLPYRCGVCGKGFQESNQRTMHENTHQRVKKKLACPVCGQEFGSPKSLAFHLKRHKYYNADVDAYQCDKCPESFSSGSKLIAHMKECHPLRPFNETCEMCGRSFSHPSNLQQHQRACRAAQKGPKTFPCKVCGKEFSRRSMVNRHTMIHRTSNARPFKCRHCDTSFMKSAARHRHELKHYARDVSVNMSKSVGQHQTTNDAETTSRAHSVRANENPDVNSGEPRTPTEVLEEMEGAVRNHGNIDSIATVYSYLNDDHGSIHFYQGLKEYQSRGMYTDVCIDEVRDKVERVTIDKCLYYRCKLCFKTIYDLVAAIKHARAHARGNYFFCGQCGRKFKRKISYDNHLDLHAQGQWREIPGLGNRQYACSMCHKFFSTNALLTSHRMTHTETLPYRCGVCDKRFRGSKQRTMHENTHQWVKKKLTCPVCCQEFSSPKSLSSHVKRHKYCKGDVDAYQCDECPEIFACGTTLITHIRECHPPRHFSQTCGKCGRSFRHPSFLQQHQRACRAAPKGPKTFRCKVCGKEFGWRNLLNRHRMIHRNPRPFECRHCDMSFRQSDERHRHEIQHHVVDVTVNMSKSVGQYQTTNNDVGTTSEAHSVKANENPDVNGRQPRTPT